MKAIKTLVISALAIASLLTVGVKMASARSCSCGSKSQSCVCGKKCNCGQGQNCKCNKSCNCK